MKKLRCWPTLNIKVNVSYFNWQVKQTAGDEMLPALKITIENHSSLCQVSALHFNSWWLWLRWQKGRIRVLCSDSCIWTAPSWKMRRMLCGQYWNYTEGSSCLGPWASGCSKSISCLFPQVGETPDTFMFYDRRLFYTFLWTQSLTERQLWSVNAEGEILKIAEQSWPSTYNFQKNKLLIMSYEHHWQD